MAREKAPITAYKILQPSTGLYSEGTSGDYWTREGKTWSSLGRLKKHIRIRDSLKGYADAVVVWADFERRKFGQFDLSDLLREMFPEKFPEQASTH